MGAAVQQTSYVLGCWYAGNGKSRLGVATFSSMSPQRVDFHLNAHNNTLDILTSVDQLTYPGGGTRTSTAIQMVNDVMFTEANGMRAESVGIPRVMVIVTDGMSNGGYAPLTQANRIKSAPVNAHVVSIGVAGYNLAELQDMATSDQDIYALKTFDRIAQVIDSIAFRVCQATPTITFGSDALTVGKCKFVYFQSQCSLDSVVVELETEVGMVHLYVGNTSNPSPFNNLGFDESSATTKTVEVTRAPGSTGDWFIGVKGLEFYNRFTINVYSNFFADNTTQNVSVSEFAPKDHVVFTPASTAFGIHYTIESGNVALPGSAAPFRIDADTGVVTVNEEAVFDYELRVSYFLRVRVVNTAVTCQNGILYINVDIEDVNEDTPVFAGAPFSGGVGVNAPPGSFVIQVTASDPDGLVYDLTLNDALRHRRQVNPFAIDPLTGNITTTQTLSLTTTVYNLTVTATDNGAPPASASAIVMLSVLPCDSCPASQYMVSTCSGVSTDVVCVTPAACGAGTFESASPTVSSNRDCSPCPSGEFQDLPDFVGTSCTPWQDPCPAGQVQVGTPSASQDRICEDPTTTAAPTPSTRAPTAAPTTLTQAPTTAPTGIAVVDTSNSDEAVASSSMAWWPALLVLILLVLLIVALVLRQQKEKKDETDLESAGMNPMYGDFIIGNPAGVSGGVLAKGADPMYVLADEGNRLWEDFRRCVAFDTMYYGNPPMRLDNAALNHVYGVLELISPGEHSLAPLRTLGRQFLHKVVPPPKQQQALDNTLHDVVDFLWSAVADDLVERALDALARNSNGSVRNLGDKQDGCEQDLCGTYVPEQNEFLQPIRNMPDLRQLAPMCVGEAVYDLSGSGNPGETYEFASQSGAPLAEYSMCDSTNASANEYAVSMPDGVVPEQEDVYTMATAMSIHNHNKRQASVIYGLANSTAAGGDSSSDVVYSLGGAAASGGSARQSAVYDFGTGAEASDTDTDMIYDNQPQGLRVGGQLESIADEATYDVGSSNCPDITSTEDDPTYGLAASGSQSVIAPAVYDTGSAESEAASPVDYNLAATASTQDTNAVLAPAEYDVADTAVAVGNVKRASYNEGVSLEALTPAAEYAVATEDTSAATEDSTQSLPPAIYDNEVPEGAVEEEVERDVDDGYIDNDGGYIESEGASTTRSRSASYGNALDTLGK